MSASRKFKIAFEVMDIDSTEAVIPKKQIVVEMSSDDLGNSAVVSKIVAASLQVAMRFIDVQLNGTPGYKNWLGMPEEHANHDKVIPE